MSYGGFWIWAIIWSLVSSFLIIPIYIYQGMIYHRLIERRNAHFARQHVFYRNVINSLEELIRRRSTVSVAAELQRARDILNESTRQEKDRRALLWAILSVLFSLPVFYVFWFLMKDYRLHSERQQEMVENINAVFQRGGLPDVVIVDHSQVPQRSFWGYLLFSIITVGLFSIYWLYVIFKDPNNHFKQQAYVENQIAGVLDHMAVASSA